MTIPLWLLCGIWFIVGWLGCALIYRLTDANGRVRRDSKGRFESED